MEAIGNNCYLRKFGPIVRTDLLEHLVANHQVCTITWRRSGPANLVANSSWSTDPPLR